MILTFDQSVRFRGHTEGRGCDTVLFSAIPRNQSSDARTSSISPREISRRSGRFLLDQRFDRCRSGRPHMHRYIRIRISTYRGDSSLGLISSLDSAFESDELTRSDLNPCDGRRIRDRRSGRFDQLARAGSTPSGPGCDVADKISGETGWFTRHIGWRINVQLADGMVLSHSITIHTQILAESGDIRTDRFRKLAVVTRTREAVPRGVTKIKTMTARVPAPTRATLRRPPRWSDPRVRSAPLLPR